MRDLLFVIILPLLIYGAYKKPVVGVGIWLWASIFKVGDWMYGFASGLPIVFMFSIITLMAYFVQNPKNKFKYEYNFNLVTFLVFFLIFWSLISTIFTISPFPTYVWDTWRLLFKIGVLYFMITLLVKDRKDFYFIIWILMLSIGFLSANEGLKFMATAGSHKIYAVRGISGDNNMFGLLALSTLALNAYLVGETKNKILKWGLIGLAMLIVFGVVATASRGAFVGLTLFAIFFWLRSDSKLTILIPFIILVIVGLMILPDAWFDRMATIEESDKDDSFLIRVIAWKIGVLVALDNPFFGGGFNNILIKSVWLSYLPFIDDVLTFMDTSGLYITKTFTYHSIYFQVIGDLGFGGFIIYMSMVAAAFFKCWGIKMKTKGEEHLVWMNNLAAMLMLSIFTYMLTGALLSMAYHDMLFLLFALTTCLEMAYMHQMKIDKRERRKMRKNEI